MRTFIMTVIGLQAFNILTRIYYLWTNKYPRIIENNQKVDLIVLIISTAFIFWGISIL